ncbi:MAG TPA: dihydrolipoamide acetyltransferase family protein, partial [Acidimicrobiia bacterium]|nr:dihydrolipoamide acetyltransferase family protein [Acidimicrobiia bacterium]
MATTVSMPQLGETVTEGTILRWAKQVGDTIAEDEVLVEISTDKVDTEVPSPAAGTILEILVNEGDTVSVGTPMVVIGAEGEGSPAAEEQAAEALAEEQPAAPSGEEEPAEPAAEEQPSEPSADDEPVEPATEEKPIEPEAASTAAEKPEEPTPAKDEKPTEPEVEAFFAKPDETETKPNLLSPVVRKLIREHEVDVSQLSGTGDGGRITRKDVEAYLASGPSVAEEAAPQPAPTSEPAPPAAGEPQPTPEPAAAPQPAPVAAAAAGGQGADEIELDRIRVRTAENMIKARQTAAHVWTSVEVDYERVERVRQAHKQEFKAAESFSLTYLPFIARATIDALRAFPVVNSSFHLEEKKSVIHRNVDLGIAVDLDQSGLVVARVRNADGLRLVGIARSIRELADKARNGKL